MCLSQRLRALSADPDSAVFLRDATQAVQLFNGFCYVRVGLKMAEGLKMTANPAIYLVYMLSGSVSGNYY